jgi:hypothetical protein
MTEQIELPASNPRHVDLDCIGPPALFAGEDAAGYETLLTRIWSTLQPRDVFEQIWARDIVDLVWEIFRLRRMKAQFMRETAHESLGKVLDKRHLPNGTGFDLAKRCARGERDARAVVNEVLASAGLTMDAVAAHSLVFHMWEFERIDRMTIMADERRDSMLREIERHRTGFGKRLRRAVDEAQDVEDAEFKVVAPAEIEAGT